MTEERMVQGDDMNLSITVANDQNDTADSVLIITVDDDDIRFVNSTSQIKKKRKKCWNWLRTGHSKMFCDYSKVNSLRKRKCYLCRKKGHQQNFCPLK